uniref:C3H1-type domain-containing protein n=1 Tax=Mycena chlorophos TaxID=658473 RepID=A0ABQ0LTP6_MYCCL|nr:predicted protein [Mycena chlorophos]
MDPSADAFKAQFEAGVAQLKLNLNGFSDLYAASTERIRQLEEELELRKHAFDGLKSKCTQLEVEQNKHQAFKDSVKGFRVVALIDGDGAIFTDDLIGQGRAGGTAAAHKLSKFLLDSLNGKYGHHAYQLWVYVFYNKRGLANALGFVDGCFDEFVVGFNQATRRFIMADVGDGKEAADAKIKAHLEDNIVLPQTFKIIFGGCHDNGYASDLRSHITAGFSDKLILLKGYAQTAREIAGLDLPRLENPDLFRAYKITGTRSRASSNSADGKCGDSQSYSDALQRQQASREKSILAPSPPNPTSSYQGTGARHVNPALPLSKQSPAPCNHFYLTNAGCSYGATCNYGHDYLLKPEHLEEIRANAKQGVCPALAKGEQCLWGDECIYGHVCPNGPDCRYRKAGKCRFKGGDMHPAGFAFMAAPPLGNSVTWDGNSLHYILTYSRDLESRNGALEARVAELEQQLAHREQMYNKELEKQTTLQAAAFDQQLAEYHQDALKAHHTLFQATRPLIACIINGDEYLFAQFTCGFDGGAHAAQSLTKQIHDRLDQDGARASLGDKLTFWITVYYNRRELLGSGLCTAQQLDEFLTGFCVRHPGFWFVDVGGLKLTANKVHVFLDTIICFPTTFRVFLAAMPSPDYYKLFTKLHSKEVLGKLMLLDTSDHHWDPNIGLGLLTVNDVFMPTRLVEQLALSSPSSVASAQSLLSSIPSPGGSALPRSGKNTQVRAVDPTLPLHKRTSGRRGRSRRRAQPPARSTETPPPCNEHYLMFCGKDHCKYSHDYQLTTDQLQALAAAAKKAPCNWIRSGRECPYGDRCCWGHACPYGTNCVRDRKCWFKADTMHSKPSSRYKPGAQKTAAELANLDAEDESLARWKASLGIVPGASGGDTSGPKVTVLTLELHSPTLPSGKKISFELSDTARLADTKKHPIAIKEDVDYNVCITFKVNHSIISGVRYIQVVKRAGVKVDKLEQMLGSYGPHPQGQAYSKDFDTDHSPSGMIARSGTYNVKSRVVDDDGNVYADFEWFFKLAKEWE